MDKNIHEGIGIAALPENIRGSQILTADHLQLLASVPEIPVIDAAFYDEIVRCIFQYYSLSPDEMEKEIHLYAKTLIDQRKISHAWQVLLSV